MSKPRIETLHWSYLALVASGLLLTVVPHAGGNQNPIHLERSFRPVPLRTESCRASSDQASERFLCEVRSQFNPKDVWYLGSKDNSAGAVPWLDRPESDRVKSMDN